MRKRLILLSKVARLESREAAIRFPTPPPLRREAWWWGRVGGGLVAAKSGEVNG